MKAFRVLFYKSKIGDGHWIDNAISLWTMLFNWGTKNYSHCEIWMTLVDGRFEQVNNKPSEMLARQWLGQCFTATMRDDIDGTVIRPAADILKHPKRWDYCQGKADDELYEKAVRWAKEKVQRNKGYGKKTILRFFMPIWLFRALRLEEKDREICSENAEEFLLIVKWICKKMFRSPRRLSRKLIKKGYRITPLA